MSKYLIATSFLLFTFNSFAQQGQPLPSEKTSEEQEYKEPLPTQGNGRTANWDDGRQMQEEAPRNRTRDYYDEEEDAGEVVEENLDSDDK